MTFLYKFSFILSIIALAAALILGIAYFLNALTSNKYPSFTGKAAVYSFVSYIVFFIVFLVVYNFGK